MHWTNYTQRLKSNAKCKLNAGLQNHKKQWYTRQAQLENKTVICYKKKQRYPNKKSSSINTCKSTVVIKVHVVPTTCMKWYYENLTMVPKALWSLIKKKRTNYETAVHVSIDCFVPTAQKLYLHIYNMKKLVLQITMADPGPARRSRAPGLKIFGGLFL